MKRKMYRLLTALMSIVLMVSEPANIPAWAAEDDIEGREEIVSEDTIDDVIMEEAGAVRSGTCGDHLTWVLNDEGVLTISGTGKMTDFYLDDEAPTIWRNSGIKQVVIQTGVTSVGKAAFNGCDKLTSITLPNSITSIGSSAFWGCSELTSFTMPDSVTSLGDFAFYNCIGLTSIVLSNRLTQIASSTFHNCSELTSVTLPDSVTSIGDFAFELCSEMTSIKIPNNLTSIGYGAFYGCGQLKNLTIPNSVTSIGATAFHSCTSLTSLTIPSGVTEFGMSTFHRCLSMTTITIPDSVKSIAIGAFHGCTALADVLYSGTKETWDSITIEKDNEYLTKANIYYECVPGVSVNEISLSPTSLELKVGESGNLTATISPHNAFNKAVTWETSDPDIATVVNGEVSALATGEAVITVRTKEGEKFATCNITVKEIKLAGIKLDKAEAVLTEGEELSLVLAYTPEDASNKKVTWSSSDETVAKVTDGLVTAIKAGKTVIKAVSEDGNYEATCEITVKKKEGPLGPEEPDLSQYTTSGNEIAVKSINLKKTVFSGIKGIKKFDIVSGDSSAVKIKGSTLTVLKTGTVTIAALNKNSEKLAEKTISLIAPDVVNTQPTEIQRRGYLDLNKYISSTIKPSSWKSSSKKIAEVSKDGLLTMKKSGTVKITVTFPSEKGMTAKKLTIKLKIAMPQFKKTSYTVKVGMMVSTAVKNAAASDITYRIENTAIASVDATGKVTGVSKGTTKLIMTVKGIDYETVIKVK